MKRTAEHYENLAVHMLNKAGRLDRRDAPSALTAAAQAYASLAVAAAIIDANR